jgi:16S rRNA (adenine1518-N6/adenine1519-N6)-dimethyltransferase
VLSIGEIIKKYNILASKSLGQNFLMNEEVCKKIAISGEIQNEDEIFEVGPGLGSLTRFLISANPKALNLIEKDERFLSILKAEYEGNFQVFHEDALKFDFTKYANFKVIANLPYNIGTELLTRWICLSKPKIMILMLQKEVVERIIAKPRSKDYGRLSVISQSFYQCEKLFDVSKGSFHPMPNVTSSVVKMVLKNVNYDAKKLGSITEKLFSNRRKILKNNLLALNINREDLWQKRAEELSLEEFISLL